MTCGRSLDLKRGYGETINYSGVVLYKRGNCMFVRDITYVAAFLVYCHRDVLAKKQHVILVTDYISCRDTLCYLGLHFHAPGTTSRFLPPCRSIYFGHLGFQGAVDVFVTAGSFQVQQSGQTIVG